jgi:hypothetical protein
VSEAFTVRVRSSAGRHSCWLAPAGGMGLSSPCCASGHESATAAVDCGLTQLRLRLTPTPATAA